MQSAKLLFVDDLLLLGNTVTMWRYTGYAKCEVKNTMSSNMHFKYFKKTYLYTYQKQKPEMSIFFKIK